jgi:hypothetical protein
LLPLPPELAERARRAFLRKAEVPTPLVEPPASVPPAATAATA